MAFDEHLASRIRSSLARYPELSERRMFGGLCFLLRGHMTAGIVGTTLMLRVGPDQFSDALAQPHARVMDFTGRPSKGMIYVDPAGIATPKALDGWLALAVAFVGSLPERTSSAKPNATTSSNARKPKRKPRTAR
jgi:TfoX/Sxy family transcriptional regulator of competence genes